MSQKVVLVPGVGEVLLIKRRGSKNIRLSVSASGKVRVSMPAWVPYATGVRFAKARADWLEKQLSSHISRFLEHGDRIGRSHRLEFIATSDNKVSTRVTQTAVIVKSGLPIGSATVQSRAEAAAERALAQQARHLLPQRLAELARKHGYSYRTVKIKKLTSRWGSCSSQKDISLSYFLIQLPWHLIDYVLVHELVHTRHLNHSPAFWNEMTDLLPSVKALRKEIKSHKPGLQISGHVS